VFRFVLTDVLVDGNMVYTEDELLPLWEGLLGQENTLTLFYGTAAAISVRYCNDGYILARAFVPPQEIIDGFTDIEVIEGYINNIVIEGEQSGSAAQIEDKKEAIKASQPLRAPDRGKCHNCGTQYALNLVEGTLS
jgi:hemolysin activation/secretion protein